MKNVDINIMKDDIHNYVALDNKNNNNSSLNLSQYDGNNANDDDDFDENEEEDGETVLIGTPIKLKKKNLDNFRRKFYKRQQNIHNSNNNNSDVKTSDDEISTPKTIKSTDSSKQQANGNINIASTNIAAQKSITDLEGIAIVLQTMPLVPFVPLNSNELFGFNQFNNLALLMATQNRLNSPNVMLPIIPRDISTPMNSGEKLDLSQFIISQQSNANPSTITLQIQQPAVNATNVESVNNISIPPTPENVNVTSSLSNGNSSEHEAADDYATNIDVNNNSSKNNNSKVATPTIPHDGTFTKEDGNQTNSSHSQQDAFTSTINEIVSNLNVENEVKILTPQKYRNYCLRPENIKSVATQTESFLFCEYCSYQHHHHHHCNMTSSNQDENHDINNTSTAINSNNINNNNSNSNQNHEDVHCKQPKEKNHKTTTDRPKWGVRHPPIKYLKASERDPFYAKGRKKRYLRKVASESEKNDDGMTNSCAFKDCPLKSPLHHHKMPTHENLCANLLPIKTDRYGRLQMCLADEQSFIMNEAKKRISMRSDYTSDTTESSIDIRHKSFFSKSHDFQDVFVD
jgi:hypothetical protein